MLDAATPLFFPQLGHVYQALAPWAEALLRAGLGLALVPHGLRNTFGMFPSTGVRSHNMTELAQQLDRDGYRPGKFWAPAISHERPSQTRTVTAGGAASPSLTTSKWW